MALNVEPTIDEGLKRGFKVVVSKDEIASKIDERLAEIGQQAKIPGFRPGKAPMTILRRRFGQAVLGEVLEKAVGDSSSQAIAERGLRPAMTPKIEIESFEQDADLAYSMEFEILPDFEITDFSTLKAERLKVKADDKQVQEALERMAAQSKVTEPLAEPRPAASGDVLVIDFAGTVDGTAHPGMSAEDHHLELGSNSFIDTFEDQLVGANVGDERKVTVTFPEGYGNEKLAGKEAVFEVTVKDILAAKPRPIDEDFAKLLGEESLDSVKAKVRERIEQEYSQMARMRLKRQVLDQLAEKHDFTVPEGMVESEFEGIWRQVEQDREQGNMDPEDAAKDEETLKAEYRDIAIRRVRLGLLLSETGRQNMIEVSQEEMQRALIQEAQRYPGREREFLEFVQKTPAAQANLRAPLFEDKVIDYILELAQIDEREVTPEELAAEAEAEEGAHDHDHSHSHGHDHSHSHSHGS